MSQKLVKWMEFTKLIREHSTIKTLIFISKLAIKIFEEVKNKHTNVDFVKQVDIAKELFIENPEKYFCLDSSKNKPNIHIVI